MTQIRLTLVQEMDLDASSGVAGMAPTAGPWAQSPVQSAPESVSPGSLGFAALAGAPNGWATRAVCAKSDPDTLFVTGAAQREAAKLCSGCPVKTECLADALDNRIEFGVWGGMTERQRRALLKRAPEITSWRKLLEEARTDATQTEAS